MKKNKRQVESEIDDESPEFFESGFTDVAVIEMRGEFLNKNKIPLGAPDEPSKCNVIDEGLKHLNQDNPLKSGVMVNPAASISESRKRTSSKLREKK